MTALRDPTMPTVAPGKRGLKARDWEAEMLPYLQRSHETMESSLRTLVCHYLDCYMHSNAIFLSERLVACRPCEENMLLLATCYVRESCDLKAHALLQGCRLPQSRYLLAHCCVNLGKLGEAERVLLAGTNVLHKGPVECREDILSDPCPIPNGAAGLRLLGLACKGSGRRESAEEYFRLSLELDPLLWVSMQALCELGADVDVEKHFGRKDLMKAMAHAEKVACYAAGSRSEIFKVTARSASFEGAGGGVEIAGGGCTACERRRANPATFTQDATETSRPMMPPPPPRAVASGQMETPVRSSAGERKNTSPVRGGLLFGTPTPGQACDATPTRGRFKTPVGATAGAHTRGAFQAAVTPTAAMATPDHGAERGISMGGGDGGDSVSRGGGLARQRLDLWPRGCPRPSWAPDTPATAERDRRSADALRFLGTSGAASSIDPLGATGQDKSIAFELDLSTRLGPYFPAVEGPGPTPGLGPAQLNEQICDAISVTQNDPPAPGYDFSGRFFASLRRDQPAAGATASASSPGDDLWGVTNNARQDRASRSARWEPPEERSFAPPGNNLMFATPGLTPIPSAQTPEDDGNLGRARLRETPSMHLEGILRDSPSMAAISDVLDRATPGAGGEDGLGGGGGGGRGGVGRAGAGFGGAGATSGRATRLATIGYPTGRMGAGAGDDDEHEGIAMNSGRPMRSGGGRRVGGRLSFSSATGPDDGSGGEGTGISGGPAASSERSRVGSGMGGSGANDERPSRAPRTGSSRFPGGGAGTAVSSTTAMASNAASQRRTGGTARGQARAVAPAAASSSGAGTPASANLAGRAPRSSIAPASGTSYRGAATPMDIESPGGVTLASARDSESVAASATGHAGVGRRRMTTEPPSSAAAATAGMAFTPGVMATPSSRRPTTRATARRSIINVNRGTHAGTRSGTYAGDGAGSTPAGSDAVFGIVGTRGDHDNGYGGDNDDEEQGELRLTRTEWESLQWDEVLSCAINFAALTSANNDMGGKHDGEGGAGAMTAPSPGPGMTEQPGDREAVIASIAMRKATHAAFRANQARTTAAGTPRGLFLANDDAFTAKVGRDAGSSIASPARGGRRESAMPGQRQGMNMLQEKRELPAGKDLGGCKRISSTGREEWATPQRGPPARGIANKGLQEVAGLFMILGKGYQLLTGYRCSEALEVLERLPPQHYCTGWVQHQVGRAYFERADYSNAKTALESMQRYDPHRLEGLDLLSTTLWHLKREVELSYLAQKVSEFDRLSPYTWCVVGNCFSLQKEHETALRFFQRAIQLDADFVYAYTLCGHEYVANEDFEKAVACFRMAIRRDRRHYNAWYGLGSIYHRQEKYDMAEYHFRRALKINSQSSVLRVYLGMVLHANKRYMDALDMLETASKSEPSNPQASFQRANVLMSMERYEEALRELEVVRDNVPKESAVYFLMGKVCKKLGRTDAAMRHFTIALDLHNKDKNLIKAAVDRLNEPDLDEEEKF